MKVIAIGNPGCGDDGVGAAVLAEIRRRGLLPEGDLAECGPDALALLDHLRPDALNVVVDAARMGLEPGQVAAFGPDEVRLRVREDRMSLHGFGLAEAFALAQGLQRMPRRVLILGVEPESVEWDAGLSAAVAAAVPRVVSLINAEVGADA